MKLVNKRTSECVSELNIKEIIMYKTLKKFTFFICLLFIPLASHAQMNAVINETQQASDLNIDARASVTQDGKLEAVALSGINAPAMHVLKSVYLSVADWGLDLNDKQKNEAPWEARFELNISDASEQNDFSVLKIDEKLIALKPKDDKPYLKGVSITPARYPPSAIRAGIVGTVKTLVKVGRSGEVDEAVILATELNTEAAHWKKQFEKSALVQAYTWKFEPPVTEHDKNYWVVSVPMTFSLSN